MIRVPAKIFTQLLLSALLAAICQASIVVHLRNNTDVTLDSVQLFYRGKYSYRKNNSLPVFELCGYSPQATGSAAQPIQEPLTAPIVSIKDNIDFAGKIVAVPSFLLKTNLPQIRAAQSRGAVGVLATLDFLCRFIIHHLQVILIVLTSSDFIVVAGYGQYLVDGKDLGELIIPVVEVALLESAKIRTLNISNIANITLLPNGKLYSLHLALKREFLILIFKEHENLWQVAYESGWMYVWQSKCSQNSRSNQLIN